MKFGLLIAMFASLVTSHAFAEKTCAFGSDSKGYETALDENDEPLFSLNERISFFKEERVSGLLETEKAALIQHYKEKGIETLEDAIQEMRSDEGYITYLSGSYVMGYDRFMIIAAYPGDNEYGAIYRLDDNDNIAEKVADIGDSEISDCTVFTP